MRYPTLAMMIALFLSAATTQVATAQITGPRILSASSQRFANLEEQLTNRLRATATDQRGFIRFVVNQVRDGRLEAKLVIAIERYALRRNRHLPFLYFERALHYEAERRGVILPAVRQFASTRVVDN